MSTPAWVEVWLLVPGSREDVVARLRDLGLPAKLAGLDPGAVDGWVRVVVLPTADVDAAAATFARAVVKRIDAADEALDVVDWRDGVPQRPALDGTEASASDRWLLAATTLGVPASVSEYARADRTVVLAEGVDDGALARAVSVPFTSVPVGGGWRLYTAGWVEEVGELDLAIRGLSGWGGRGRSVLLSSRGPELTLFSETGPVLHIWGDGDEVLGGAEELRLPPATVADLGPLAGAAAAGLLALDAPAPEIARALLEALGAEPGPVLDALFGLPATSPRPGSSSPG